MSPKYPKWRTPRFEREIDHGVRLSRERRKPHITLAARGIRVADRKWFVYLSVAEDLDDRAAEYCYLRNERERRI